MRNGVAPLGSLTVELLLRNLIIQIVRQTSSRLLVRSYPWLIWMFGVVFTAAGVMMNPALNGQTLTCDRKQSIYPPDG
ncbi:MULTISPECIES: hypothetical protein [Aerosakkonema]|uniref:hypothetical protein n=1 Tax=Aerosakkonema TaxID=1246629 RepID=UPI0035BAEEBB